MKSIILVIVFVLMSSIEAFAAPLPCAAPAKNFADLQNLVKSGCSPITFDSNIKGQTLTATSTIFLSSGVVLDGGSNSITLTGNGAISPLVVLVGGSTIQNITLTNPNKTVVSIGDEKSNNNKLANVTISNSKTAVYVVGAQNSIYQSSFSGNTTAIQLDGGNNNIQFPIVTSYQVSKDDETKWVIKGSTLNGQAIGGTVDLYLADPSAASAQGKTYKTSAVVAADGTFTFTLPYAGKGTETAPYTLLVTDAAGNSSAFSVSFVPENNANFFTLVDPDADNVFNSKDKCPTVKDPNQEDFEKDGVGDACDNCDTTSNKDQANMDKDSDGDSCDEDMDGDGVKDADDNCDTVVNVDQNDADFDGLGDACDKLTVVDQDSDGILDIFDNCKATPNANQANMDNDTLGDPCDEDADGDSVQNLKDNCPYLSNITQADSNKNGVGDVCETANGVIDSDGDGQPDAADNCPFLKNPDQADMDKDSTGDACDVDIDGDGVSNVKDNCPLTANANQENVDVDALGDACEIAGTTGGPTASQSAAAPATGSSGCSLSSGAAQLPISSALATSVLAIGVLMLVRKTRKTIR